MKKLINCLLTLTFVFSIISVSFADLNEGLVVYYPFNGNANDESGNSNHATKNGGVDYTIGKIGMAASFDGKNDTLTTTIPIVKKTYSVSMHAKFYSNNRVENQLFYLTRSNKTDRLGYLSTYPVGKKTWHYGSRRYNKGWEDRGTSILDPTGLSDNVWYHLVFILNDNEISLYVNGINLRTIKSSYNSDIEASNNLLFIIGGTTERYQWMHGLIDEVRLYNRVLSQSEIQQLYSANAVISGCIKLKNDPVQKGKAMLMQSGEIFQSVPLDNNGCYNFYQANEEKPFSVVIRKTTD
ncbi:conserved hypothetical protein, secreted [Candidatus Magnetomorum sp. HK-1]|nr:conserved hypothetical protein, secreted [Candidatus Magnetomorum sp. HK-1]